MCIRDSLAVVAACTEWTKADFSITGISPWFLMLDCVIAFSLNLIQIKIIGKLSALTYMFAGYAKGFLTVAISVVFYKETVDALEVTGYVVMLFGQLLWSLRKLKARGPQPPQPPCPAQPKAPQAPRYAAPGRWPPRQCVAVS